MLVKSAKHLIFEVRFVMLFKRRAIARRKFWGILDWFSIDFLQENHLFEVQNVKISRLRRAKISFFSYIFFLQNRCMHARAQTRTE